MKPKPNYQTIPEKVFAIQVHIGGPRDNLKRIRECGFRIKLDTRQDSWRLPGETKLKPRILVNGSRAYAFTGDMLVRKENGHIYVHSYKMFKTIYQSYWEYTVKSTKLCKKCKLNDHDTQCIMSIQLGTCPRKR